MKKLILGALLLMSLGVKAISVGRIEQAIQDSDESSIRSLLKNESLSAYDKEIFLDLAREIIKKRHSEWKTYASSCGISFKEALLVGIVTMLNKNDFYNELAPTAWLLVIVSLPFVIVKRVMDYIKYNDLYNNSLRIKHIIQKSDLEPNLRN